MFLHTLRRVLQENPDLWNCWGKKKSRKRTKAGVEIGKGKRSLREMKTSAVSARLVLGCKNSTCAGTMLLAACILFLGRDICEYASTMCCRRIFIFIVYKVQVLLLASAVYCCCFFASSSSSSTSSLLQWDDRSVRKKPLLWLLVRYSLVFRINQRSRLKLENFGRVLHSHRIG